MGIKSFDHVNVLTSRLAEMVAFYEDVLGLKRGARPDFGVGGAWLYLDDKPLVHLVETAHERRAIEPKIEHFAFAASGLQAFLDKLSARGIALRLSEVPDAGVVQVNFADPDGNHIHVDFPLDEAKAGG